MKINSPYMGDFRVTNLYSANHDGLDLVGITSKEIHATVTGLVHFAGWENANNKKQGFGQFVCIKGNDGLYYYYGHLSEIKCKTGDNVKITDVIGIEGHTGYTIPDNENGSHCHYCIRPNFCSGNSKNVSIISGIPNDYGIYNDGYKENVSRETFETELKINGKTYILNLIEKSDYWKES